MVFNKESVSYILTMYVKLLSTQPDRFFIVAESLIAVYTWQWKCARTTLAILSIIHVIHDVDDDQNNKYVCSVQENSIVFLNHATLLEDSRLHTEILKCQYYLLYNLEGES